MKKKSVILSILSVLSIGMLASLQIRSIQLPLTESIQAGSVILQPGESIQVSCSQALSVSPIDSHGVIVACADVPVSPTFSPVPPTPTISPSATVVPTLIPPTGTNSPQIPTSTAPGVNIQPFAGAPLCAQHDVMMYHGLWNSQLGCHYDHEHGDDIAVMGKQYFGEWGSLWGGMWMYPFESSPIENKLAPLGKHPGMKGIYRGPDFHPLPACGTFGNNDLTGDFSPNCVVAVRGLIHVLGGLNDLAARYHSNFLEIYSCKPPYRQPQDCGVFRTGGLSDYGQLQAPHYSTRRVRPTEGYTLPTFQIDFGAGLGRGIVMTFTSDNQYPDLPAISGEPYVFGVDFSLENLAQYRKDKPASLNSMPGKYTIDQWSNNDGDCEPRPSGDPCHNRYYHILYQVGDAWHLVDPIDIRNVHWICEDGKPCYYNGTLTGLNEIMINPVPEWDAFDSLSDGQVTWSGYSDRWGNPRPAGICSSISIDCIPMAMDSLPIGVASSRSDNGCECVVWEHDIYFNGQPSGWVEFPN